ncbi:hypothetical protein GCM10020255_016530 [Rhodococcus baikonurensis]
MTPVRTLPIRVAPLPGEAIDSWLEAIAHRTDTTFVDLDTALHHEDRSASGRVQRLSMWPMHLAPGEVNTIAAATELSAAAIEAMTLVRYDGVALSSRSGRDGPGLALG